MRKIYFTTCILAFLTFFYAKCQDAKVWEYKTRGQIVSSPIVHNNAVFFGSKDGHFYSLDIHSGLVNWKYKTEGEILSSPTIFQDKVYFESKNQVYALACEAGDVIWKHDSLGTRNSSNIDPWDYHHSSPIVYDSIVYIGLGNGKLYGFNFSSGEIVFEYSSNGNAAIRTKPIIKDDIIYFGDWNGIVYAVDINTQTSIWEYKTYQTKPYTEFGMIVSDMVLYNNIVTFGSRNSTVFALDASTGNPVWTYNNDISPSGSWIPGTPVFSDSIMYIGGSDNHSLVALNASNGKKEWYYRSLQNIFSKPIIIDNYILFVTGNSGTYNSPNPPSNGEMIILNKTSGELSGYLKVDGSIFSSPAIHDSIVCFGTNSGRLYAINCKAFIDIKMDPNSLPEYEKENKYVIYPNPASKVINIKLNIQSNARVSLILYDLDGRIIDVFIDDKYYKTGNYELVHSIKNTHIKNGLIIAVVKIGNDYYKSKLIVMDFKE